MAGKIISFGSFTLTPANGVYAAEIGEMSPAQRDITVLAQAGYRGIKILRVLDGAKIVTVRGIISKDSEANFIAAIRDFNKALMGEGANIVPSDTLKVETSEGTYVYEDVIVQDTDKIFPIQKPFNITWIPFEVRFLVPKGFARSTTNTVSSFINITTNPSTGFVTIEGTANAEPTIILTFHTASTITEFTFLNSTTNESITCTGLTIANGDVITIDTAAKVVKQNTTIVRYSGVIPLFIVGRNDFKVSFAGSSNTVASQTSYDDARQVYGNNWLAQSFQVASPATVPQLNLMIQKVVGNVYQLLDDFEDNSINTTIWQNRTGTYAEEGGKLRVGKKNGSGDNGNVNTGARDGVSGFEIAFDWSAGGGEGPDVYVYVQSNGTGATGGTVEARSQHAVGRTVVSGTGALAGLGSFTFDGSSGRLKVEQDGSTLKVYVNDTLQLSGTFEIGSAPVAGITSEGGSGTDFYIQASYVNERIVASANSDLTIRVETNNAGAPSGTIVTNGQVTIPASSIGTSSFSEIIASFASSLSLSAATTYHIVVKQSGGDINNYYQLKVYSAGAYASGNSETTIDGGSNWTQRTAEDLFFKVYTSLPTGFNVGLEIDHYASHYSVV